MVKCLPEFQYFDCILEKLKKNIFNIKRSKVTDYAALRDAVTCTGNPLKPNGFAYPYH